MAETSSPRLCAPCARWAFPGAAHNSCPDPYGEKGLCFCYTISDLHQRSVKEPFEDGPSGDFEYSGGLRSAQWEAREEDDAVRTEDYWKERD